MEKAAGFFCMKANKLSVRLRIKDMSESYGEMHQSQFKRSDLKVQGSGWYHSKPSPHQGGVRFVYLNSGIQAKEPHTYKIPTHTLPGSYFVKGSAEKNL